MQQFYFYWAYQIFLMGAQPMIHISLLLSLPRTSWRFGPSVFPLPMSAADSEP